MLKKSNILLLLAFVVVFAFAVGCAEESYQVNVEAYPSEGGQVTGEGTYPLDTEVSVEAEPAEGYIFKEWQEEGETVSTEKIFKFAVNEDRNLTALFKKEVLTGETVEYADERKTIKVLNEEGEVVFEYTIDEFKNWAQDNWENIFEETPAFVEERPVDPQNFSFFDDAAALSPGGEKLAFSVHDYYAATFMSFVGIIDLETGEVSLVDEENRGQIDEFFWSPEGMYLAYALNTAKGGGFFLSNDNVDEMTKEFTLSADDIGETVDSENQISLPNFRELEWIEVEEETRLKFTADYLEDGQAGTASWSIDAQGTDLRKED